MVNEMRDRLVELYAKAKRNMWGRTFHSDLERNMYIADYLIANDVVPVVRCKDCKYCRNPKGKERYRYFEGVLLCESYEMSDDVCAVNPDDYCSYGERRCEK